MYIYALNGESYWTPCACLAVHHFIHTNPYNFANIPSPSKTHEMLVFSKIQPNWARPSVLPNSHCFDNLDRARLMWSPGGAGGGEGGGGVKYGVFTSASIFFFAKRSMVSESNAYYTEIFPFLVTVILYCTCTLRFRFHTSTLLTFITVC